MRVRRIGTTSNTTPASPASSGTNSRLESLNEADAARYIGMSAAWLKKSRTKGHRTRSDAPPFVRVGTRRVVYRLVDLDAYSVLTSSMGCRLRRSSCRLRVMNQLHP